MPTEQKLVPVQALYNAFLALLESDEWEAFDELQQDIDMQQIALAAKPWFKFPRCSLDWNEEPKEVQIDENTTQTFLVATDFIDPKISNTELQIWAMFMKCCWYDRVVDSWENLRPYYTERDFSPGKMMGEFRGRSSDQLKKAKELESIYYRSINGKPFAYENLAGGN